jgi:hypothetical protein
MARSRGLGDVYKRQVEWLSTKIIFKIIAKIFGIIKIVCNFTYRNNGDKIKTKEKC